MEQLKPCPCCNGKTYYYEETKSIICSECGLEFSATWTTYPEWHAADFLIEAFNARYEKECIYTEINGLYLCSICGIENDYVDEYCPSCGSKVVGGNNG